MPSKPLLSAMLVLVAALGVSATAVHYLEHLYLQRQHYLTLQAATALRARIEGQLDSNFAVLQGLRAELVVNPEITEARFAQVAERLLQGRSQISHVALAPGLVVSMIYPLSGNEQAIGLDYRGEPEQLPAVERALLLRRSVLAGPLELIQGGHALVAREPVFTAEPNSPQWGVVAGVIRMDAFMQGIGLPELSQDYRVSLRGTDGLGEMGEVFQGEEDLFAEDAELSLVTVPGGRWQLALKPRNGWELPAPLRAACGASAVLLSGLLAALVFLGLQSKSIRVVHRRELEARARTDHLTGLPNRYEIHRQLNELIAIARDRDDAFCLMFVDLDNFKDINDSMGHDVGDEVLIQVAARMKSALGRDEVIGRLGGDEFLVLLPRVKGFQDAENAVQSLFASLDKSFELDEREVTISASAGLAMYPLDGGDATVLLQHADRAVYAAKAAGRSGWSFFDYELRRQAERQVELTQWIREGLAEWQFTVHYQPVHRLSDGRVSKCEALLRWRHPLHGEIPPAEFIPVAEKSGLIRQLGVATLEQVCIDLGNLHARGYPLQVSVNRSLAEFTSDQSVNQWYATLQHYRIDPACVILEITESLLARDVPVVDRNLHKVRAMGFPLALDDFGTGYSAIDYLRHLPVEYIKIDRSFVQEADRSAQGRTLLKVLADLAAALGIETIAEGVETQAQLEFLRVSKVAYAQGHLFACAMSLDDLLHYLTKHALVEKTA